MSEDIRDNFSTDEPIIQIHNHGRCFSITIYNEGKIAAQSTYDSFQEMLAKLMQVIK